MTAIVQLAGQKFGRLTVVRRGGTSKHGAVKWLCVCECGSPTGILEVESGSLRSGCTRSCGCLRKEVSGAIGRVVGHLLGTGRTTHGHCRSDKSSATYVSWVAMKQRCYKKNAANYGRYGGRGITVCDRWLNSFENFLADMGERPKGLTLDRYPNNSGNYEPGNCRWATAKEQRANRHEWLPAREVADG